jgi:hypothetical protein
MNFRNGGCAERSLVRRGGRPIPAIQKGALWLQTLRQIAAVHGDELASDLGGIGQGEENNNPGNIGRFCEPPQRSGRDQLLFKCSILQHFFTISVRVNQGRTPLTRMPSGPHSTARERVMWSRAAFVEL